MKHLALFCILFTGCATVAPKATNTDTKDPFADIMALMDNVPVVKETTPPCLSNGCTFNVFEEIDDDMAKDFSKWMDSAKNNGVTLVDIKINSPGGSVDAGYSMARKMEGLDKQGVKSNCTVDGTAASMAFSILQSCTYRYMTARSTLMTHQEKVGSKAGHMMTEGQLQDAANMVHADNIASAAHCVHRMKITVQEFLDKVNNKEWWITADEALKVGAVDQIVKF